MKHTINGAEIAFDDIGSGHALLFVHAGIADRRMWDHQMTALSPEYRVVRMDLRGFGDSEDAVEPFANYEDVRGLLDALEIDQAIVIGDSMGGDTALEVTLAYPERVVGLVLVSTRAALTDASPELKMVWEAADAAFERGDIDAATEIETVAWIDGRDRTAAELDPAFRAMAKEMIQLTWDRVDPNAVEIEQRKLDPPRQGRLAEVRVPTLLVHGDRDFAEIAESMQVLAGQIPGARSAVIENASHLPPMERPEQFNAILCQFLENI
jgi:3-oxoadipate enol-lactonase